MENSAVTETDNSGGTIIRDINSADEVAEFPDLLLGHVSEGPKDDFAVITAGYHHIVTNTFD